MTIAYDAEWTEYERSKGPPPPTPPSIEGQKEAFNQLLIQSAKQLLPPPSGIQTRNENVTPDVDVRVYTPPNAGPKPLPLVVYIHGGGWFAGSLDTEDHTCRTICGGFNCVLVSVGYRKGPSPQFKLPALVDDCYFGYQYAIQNAARFGADPSRCIVAGGSAGGGLAIALTYRVVCKGEPVVGLVAISPMSMHPDAVPEKYKSIHTSSVENGGSDVPFVTWDMVVISYAAMAGPELYADLTLFPQAGGADAVKGFPPTYITNTDREAVRDDGAVLEAELRDAGVPVKRDVMHNLPHYFWSFPLKKSGKEFRRKLVDGFKWTLAQAT